MQASVIRAAVAACVALSGPGIGAQERADRWVFSVTPYLWLPGVEAELRHGPPPGSGGSPNVGVDSGSLLGSIDMAAMVAGEARRGRWVIVADGIYLDLGRSSSIVRSVDFDPGRGPVNVTTTALDAGTSTELRGTLFTLLAGYAAITGAAATLDVMAGVRGLRLKAGTDWRLSAAVAGPAGGTEFAREGSVEGSDELLTGIVAVRGRARLGAGGWFADYHADVGSGSSARTWQLAAGLGHAFGWGDAVVGYRRLHYRAGGARLIERFDAAGITLAARFSF